MRNKKEVTMHQYRNTKGSQGLLEETVLLATWKRNGQLLEKSPKTESGRNSKYKQTNRKY